MTTCVQLHDVTFAYRPGRPVLKDIRLAVETGTFLAVVGPNGAGKSTLISLLAGLLRPQSGTISIDGRDIRSYSRRHLAAKVALVQQESVPAFGFSVSETVLMARTPYYSQLGFERQADRRIVADALEMTDTAQFASRPLAGLSGGERQRVFIARALAQDTPIILLDEPTSFLDLKHQVAIYDLLKSIQRGRDRTIIAITHDINLAAQYCDQALLLQPYSGTPAATGTDRPPKPSDHYRMGSTHEVLSRKAIENAFGVRVFSTPVGAENVFLPLGKMAKDADRTTSL
jgi:iron complex transport system ATP-binding protein